ncbi:hypothetical protein Egran_05499 [Elaphomyces granulatus]|uniref:5'-deoxynucleotidase n=1 Tax=Elaphomyces granulatus TaxID=519963 RepID=A0A232LRE3_9EURO|nr:hypothetical protein Egran_05499 [Elaphomyces granulatus]
MDSESVNSPNVPIWTTQSVLATIAHPPEEHSSSPMPFFHLLERLKTTKREGWRRLGLAHGESIADHMYRMAIMTMLAPPSLATRLDLSRCTHMALVHDMAESLVGDITPVDPTVSKPEKARREAAAIDYIATTLLGSVPGGPRAASDIRSLFEEYEANETLTARFVHDIDKIELLLQMVEYERSHSVDLSEFTSVVPCIKLPEMQAWAGTVLKEREVLWEQRRT